MASIIKLESGFAEICSNCEQMELEGVATAEVYCQLLALYLLQNDICNAKFLWKRIPDTTKASLPELGKVWNVGCTMWRRDFPAVYLTLQQEWTTDIKSIMDAIEEQYRQRAFNLVGKAYTTIRAEDFAVFVGMTVDLAVNAAVLQGWTADPSTRMITPKSQNHRHPKIFLFQQKNSSHFSQIMYASLKTELSFLFL